MEKDTEVLKNKSDPKSDEKIQRSNSHGKCPPKVKGYKSQILPTLYPKIPESYGPLNEATLLKILWRYFIIVIYPNWTLLTLRHTRTPKLEQLKTIEK